MKCERCGVTIADDKVAKPNRCVDWRCPTMPDDLRWKPRKKEEANVEPMRNLRGRVGSGGHGMVLRSTAAMWMEAR